MGCLDEAAASSVAPGADDRNSLTFSVMAHQPCASQRMARQLCAGGSAGIYGRPRRQPPSSLERIGRRLGILSREDIQQGRKPLLSNLIP